jgi:hypothetical protein
MLRGVFDGFYQGFYTVASGDPTGTEPYPLPNTGSPSTAHVLQFLPSTTQPQRDTSWAILATALDDASLYRSRNLWYLGHGFGNAIGGDLDPNFPNSGGTIPGALPESSAFRLSGQIDAVLGNRRFNQPMSHPYRFVFMDGCSTATGEWPAVFGIPVTAKGQSYYVAPLSGTFIARPNAFVGWSADIYFSPPGTYPPVYPGFARFRQELITRWQSASNPGFRQCVVEANAAAKAYNPQAVDPQTGAQPMEWSRNIVITGYDRLTFRMGNYQDPTAW